MCVLWNGEERHSEPLECFISTLEIEKVHADGADAYNSGIENADEVTKGTMWCLSVDLSDIDTCIRTRLREYKTLVPRGELPCQDSSVIPIDELCAKMCMGTAPYSSTRPQGQRMSGE